MLILTGCGKKAEIKFTVDELLRTPYTAECTAKIFTNKTENEYSYICEYSEDGTYSVDYGDMKISVSKDGTILSGCGAEKKTGLAEGEFPLTPTYFFEKYLLDGKVRENNEGYVLSCSITDDNPYRAKAEMKTDKNFVPVNMQIKDKKGNIVIDIEITDFKRKAE